jgi:D-sedoheptulose 7-phosphate isomerase
VNLINNFKSQLSENINTHLKLLGLHKEINKSIKEIYKALKKGGKILFCGNGGSAADAQHLAAEFLVRLRPMVNRMPLPALSLAQDTSTLTACGNDYGFNYIFSRPLDAIANKKDILFVISTSGNSQNIYEVLKKARKKNIKSIGLLGGKGGKCLKICNYKIVIPSNITARIQECHIFLGHFILEQVENLLIQNKKYEQF